MNNYGGLVYRVDTGKAGVYHIEVEVIGSSSDTWIAPIGMNTSRLTGTSNWDNCGQVPRTVSAVWEGSKWSYDFATGEDFIEIEIEPTSMPSESYSFNETISAWGQTLKNYFDLDKVNVVNYSMGGKAMKSNYNEGRFDEILIRGHQGDYVCKCY